MHICLLGMPNGAKQGVPEACFKIPSKDPVTSVSTVFQSYQDDGWMIMKGCVQWNSVLQLKRSLPRVGI